MPIAAVQLTAEILPDLAPLDAGLAQADQRLAAFASKERAGIQVGGIDPALARQTEQLGQRLKESAQASDRAGQSYAETGRRASAAERETLTYASAVARLQVAQGSETQAAQTLRTALTGVSQGTIEATRTATQLERVQQQATGSGGRFAESLRGIQSTLGALGLVAGVQQLFSFGGEAITAANNLEKTEASVRALSGSSERYAEVLEVARSGQDKYGGSLQENLQGLGSLVNLSNRAGVELTQLDNISRRLAVVDPLQGIEGANYALKELLNGTGATSIRSLVERFELPKAALKELTSGTLDAGEKLQRLDAILADVGITNEVLANRTNTNAVAYDRLGSAFDNAKVKAGELLATGLLPLAKGATDVLHIVEQGLGNYNAAADKQEQLNRALLEGADNYVTYSRQVEATNQTIDQSTVLVRRLIPHVKELTFAQREYARALIEQGVSATEATEKASALEGIQLQQALATAETVNRYRDADPAIRRATSATEEHAAATEVDTEAQAKLQEQLQAIAEKGAAATERLRDSQQDYARDVERLRSDHARKLEDIQRENADRLSDIDRDHARRAAAAAKELAGDIARINVEGNEKLRDLENSFRANQEQAAAEHAAKLKDLQEQLLDVGAQSTEQATERRQTYEERLADLQQRAADQRADRAQDLADRLTDLQQQLTEATDQAERDRIQRQIERAEREAAQQQARADRDLARQQEKLDRELAQDQQAADKKAAAKLEQLRAEIAAEEQAEHERQARAQAAYDADRAKLFERYSGEIAALRQKHADEAAAEQERYAQQRADQEAAAAARLAKEQETFAQQQADRAAAFAEQQEQLQEALGKELLAYTTTQEQLTQITATEAAKRRAIIAQQYGLTGDGGAGAFGALANGAGAAPGLAGLAALTPGLLDTASALTGAQFGPGLRSAVGQAAAGAMQVQIVIPGVGEDITALAYKVRDVLIAIDRSNGSSGVP